MYEPRQSTLLSRKATIERVEHIIRTEYGPEYSVTDRSLYTYAHDLDVAPLELAVHVSQLLRTFRYGPLRRGISGRLPAHGVSPGHRGPAFIWSI